MKYTLRLIPLLLLFCLTGCREPATFEVALYDDESLNRGDKVYLEGEPVAHIEEIYLIGEDQPVAKIRLNDTRFEDLFIKGIQRKPGRGEIHLEKPNLSGDANPETLLTGSRIPLRSIPLPPSVWPPNQESLIFIAIILVLLLVVFFVVLKFIRMAGTIILLALASVLAWWTYPHAMPYAEQAVELLESKTDQAALDANEDPDEAAETIDRAMSQITIFLRKEHISPTYVAFGSLAVIYYLVFSILSGFIAKIPLIGIPFRRS